MTDMNRYSLVVLVLVLVVIGGVYFLQRSNDMEEATFAIPDNQFSIDAERLVRVDISRLTGFVRLEKVRGEWKVTQPVFAAADPAFVRELQEGLSRFRVAGMVSTNPTKQHIFQVDDNGTSVAFFTDDGMSLPLIIGKAAPSGGSAFVRPPLSDTVYLAHGLTPLLVNRELRDWRLRTVYETSPDAITSLVITSGQRKLDLRKRELGWVGRDRTLPPDVISPALLTLARLRAEAFVDTPLIVRGQPRFEVEVGGTQPVKVDLYPAGNGDSNYVMKTSGSPNLVVVTPALARALQRIAEYLAPPPAPPPTVIATTPAPTIRQPEPVVQPPPVSRQTPQSGEQAGAERRRTRQVVPLPPTSQQRTSPVQPSDRTQRTLPDDRRTPRRTAEPAPRRVEDEGDLTVHTVRRGESIGTIAARYDVTVEQIKKWNGLQTDVLAPGTEVYVFVKRK